jgi:hypothetical protein
MIHNIGVDPLRVMQNMRLLEKDHTFYSKDHLYIKVTIAALLLTFTCACMCACAFVPAIGAWECIYCKKKRR